jgi:hypothetical protein
MVRKIGLIGAIFNTLGGFLVFAIIAQAKPEEAYAYLSMDHIEDIFPVGLILVNFGVILMYIDTFRTDKKMLKIGSILGMISTILVISTYMNGMTDGYNSFAVYGPVYNIGLILLIIAMVLYLVGCIHFRFNFKVGLFTGPLLLILPIALFLFSVLILGELTSYDQLRTYTNNIDGKMESHISLLAIWILIMIIHSWLFTFMAKTGKFGKDSDDEELSVAGGGAFQSYVDKSAYQGYTPPKPSDDDIVFEF